MAKSDNPVGVRGKPTNIYVRNPVTARGSVNSYFTQGPKFDLNWHMYGILVTFLEKGSTPKCDVLVPWGNIANIIIGADDV